VAAGAASQPETARAGKSERVAVGAASQPETARLGKGEGVAAAEMASQANRVRPS